MLTSDHRDMEKMKVMEALKSKLGARDYKEAAGRAKKLLEFIASPAFRYNATLEDEAADEFVARMMTVEPDPRLCTFMEESREYSENHPIREVE